MKDTRQPLVATHDVWSLVTWATLTVNIRERGSVATISSIENSVSSSEHTPTLLSHPGIRVYSEYTTGLDIDIDKVPSRHQYIKTRFVCVR